MTNALPSVPLERLEADDPRELGEYRLLGRLGSGGMGIAYLAEGPDDWAVVKAAWRHFSADRDFRARLARELGAMRSLESPRTVRVIEAHLDVQYPWFVMEFVPGVTLLRRVDEQGPLTAAEVSSLALGLAEGLTELASKGVTHRDLKPANVMLSPTGPRLIDFGIADVEGATQLTRTGSVMGSPGWLAPEQITGDEVGPATDVHAWALCVLFGVVGSSPFEGSNTTATMYKVLHDEPVVPTSMDARLRRLVEAALAKDPSRRPSAREVLNALGGVVSKAPIGWPIPTQLGAEPIASGDAAEEAQWFDQARKAMGLGDGAKSHQEEEVLPDSTRVARTPASYVASPISVAGPASSAAVGGVTDFRREAVAEALRRDPSLRADSEPETLARLDAAVTVIARELELKEEVARITREEEEAARAEAAAAQAAEEERARAEAAAAQAAKEQQERIQRAEAAAAQALTEAQAAQKEQEERAAAAAAQAAREEAERIQRAQAAAAQAAEEEAERIQRADELAAMNPVKRWVVTHRGVTAVLGVLVVLALLGGSVTAVKSSQAAADKAKRESVFRDARQAGSSMAGKDFTARDLSGLDLSNLDFHSANLQFANLQGANLQSANLQGANLIGANLQGVNLQGANLQGANLLDANVNGANFDGAKLRGATCPSGYSFNWDGYC